MTGDIADIHQRLRGYLPARWFGNPSDPMPIVDAVLYGIAACSSFLYSLYAYAVLQTRIKTATDGWLDLISADYFGPSLPRAQGETDASFRARIIAAILQPRATRPAIVQVITALTGNVPAIFEPWRPADTGAYDMPQSLAYNTLGGYGSLQLPAQYFITVQRPRDLQTAGSIAGYGVSIGAYNTASKIEFLSLAQLQNMITDAEIYDTVADTTAAGVIPWTRIEG